MPEGDPGPGLQSPTCFLAIFSEVPPLSLRGPSSVRCSVIRGGESQEDMYVLGPHRGGEDSISLHCSVTIKQLEQEVFMERDGTAYTQECLYCFAFL